MKNYASISFGTAVFIFGNLFFSACTKKANPEKIEIPPPVEITKPTIPAVEKPTNLEKTVVASLKKTPCFGTCPVFEFELLGSGEAIFIGKKQVGRIGKYRATVPKNWLSDLVKNAEAAGFFNFSTNYPTNGRKIADFPVTITFLRTAKTERRIENNFDAPLGLQNFEAFFLEKIEMLEWVKISD